MADNSENVRQFNLALDEFIGRQLPETALAAQKKVTLDALRGVVQKSPVDTGRFRGNWQVSTSPDIAAIEAADQLPRGTAPAAVTEARAVAGMAGAQPYGTIYVTNGLPYGERLENGYSHQAPQGMVALTAAELTQRLIELRQDPGSEGQA